VGAQLPQQLYCTVGGDNVAGGALAGAHLLAQGRQRAFFGDINLPEIGQRYEGLCQALAQAGMAVDPALQVRPRSCRTAAAWRSRNCNAAAWRSTPCSPVAT
jgi:DNA-binding LacI/PurR family transcriptional regulator